MFGRKPFLEQELQDWHLDCWAWLLRYAGGLDKLRNTKLVLPNRDCFPSTDKTGHARAQYFFESVKSLAGMADWPVELEAQQARPDRLGPITALQHGESAAGTFSHDGNAARITYDPRHIKTPVTLVATFAHELAHYLTGSFPELLAPPDMMEHATDVATIFMGFGVFGANSAFNFSQHTEFDSQGWRSERLGYLTESEWAFGLAMFCTLTDRPIDTLKDHLKPSIWGETKRAARIIARDNLDMRATAA
jgi:hypothetical protein